MGIHFYPSTKRSSKLGLGWTRVWEVAWSCVTHVAASEVTFLRASGSIITADSYPRSVGVSRLVRLTVSCGFLLFYDINTANLLANYDYSSALPFNKNLTPCWLWHLTMHRVFTSAFSRIAYACMNLCAICYNINHYFITLNSCTISQNHYWSLMTDCIKLKIRNRLNLKECTLQTIFIQFFLKLFSIVWSVSMVNFYEREGGWVETDNIKPKQS